MKTISTDASNRCTGTISVWSRVTGFFRPVQDWNPGKGVNGEFADRNEYDIKEKKVKEEK